MLFMCFRGGYEKMLPVFHIDQLPLPCVTRRLCEYTQRVFLLQAPGILRGIASWVLFCAAGLWENHIKTIFTLKLAGVFWKKILDTEAKDVAKFLLVSTQNHVCETQLHPTCHPWLLSSLLDTVTKNPFFLVTYTSLPTTLEVFNSNFDLNR